METTETTRSGRAVSVTRTVTIPVWVNDKGIEITTLIHEARFYDGDPSGNFWWAVAYRPGPAFYPLTAIEFAEILAR